MNRIELVNDNLEFIKSLIKEGVLLDLIYIDPPFNTGRNFGEFDDNWASKSIALEVAEVSEIMPDFIAAIKLLKLNEATINYLFSMALRCWYMRKLLKDTGSFYYHCDPTAGHYIKTVLDYIFGMNNFRNEIVWCYTSASNVKKNFPKKHDTIFRYSKTDFYVFNPEEIRIPYKKLNKQGKRCWSNIDNEEKRISNQLEKGKIVEDYWIDIAIACRGNEYLGYPTQKPEALLERIILASSNPGDLIGDFYLGSGTTAAVAIKNNRGFVGCDINKQAVNMAMERVFNLTK